MLFFENSKYLKSMRKIIENKILQLRNKKETKINKSVEQFVEIRRIHDTPNSVISGICEIFSLENDTFVSTKPQNKNQLYNSFLKFCWSNKNANDYLPEAGKVQSELGIGKTERLELQARGIKEKVLEKSKNNKIFFSKNFNLIEEVLNGGENEK